MTLLTQVELGAYTVIQMLMSRCRALTVCVHIGEEIQGLQCVAGCKVNGPQNHVPTVLFMYHDILSPSPIGYGTLTLDGRHPGRKYQRVGCYAVGQVALI
jgi:hypothetical protein